jgi:hypothetical protein
MFTSLSANVGFNPLLPGELVNGQSKDPGSYSRGG